MPRRRREVPAHRYHLTLARPIAERLAAYAETNRQPLSRAAATLIEQALTRANTDEDDELRDARRQIEALTGRVQSLRRQIAQAAGREPAQPAAARWEWPIDKLLADGDWWDRWLPRLNELMGRRPGSVFLAADAAPPVDERGYLDLLGFLFPIVADGKRTLTWRSPNYARIARSRRTIGPAMTTASSGPDMWEPVVRHVAEALSALEATGEAGVDPYLRMRAEVEITGPWTRVLRHLVGEDQPQIPTHRLA